MPYEGGMKLTNRQTVEHLTSHFGLRVSEAAVPSVANVAKKLPAVKRGHRTLVDAFHVEELIAGMPVGGRR